MAGDGAGWCFGIGASILDVSIRVGAVFVILACWLGWVAQGGKGVGRENLGIFIAGIFHLHIYLLTTDTYVPWLWAKGIDG